MSVVKEVTQTDKEATLVDKLVNPEHKEENLDLLRSVSVVSYRRDKEVTPADKEVTLVDKLEMLEHIMVTLADKLATPVHMSEMLEHIMATLADKEANLSIEVRLH